MHINGIYQINSNIRRLSTPFDPIIKFDISYKAKETNCWALYIEYLLVLNCIVKLGKYHDGASLVFNVVALNNGGIDVYSRNVYRFLYTQMMSNLRSSHNNNMNEPLISSNNHKYFLNTQIMGNVLVSCMDNGI